MKEYREKSFFALELDKILDMLKEEAVCADTKEMIERIHPISSYRDVVDEMKKTSSAYTLIMGYSMPEINFRSSFDIILNKLGFSAQLMMKELRLISDFLSNMNILIRWRRQIESYEGEIDYLFDNLNSLAGLKTNIDKIVLSEDEIADDASKELFEIRNKLRSKSIKIKDSLNNLIKSPSYQKVLQDNIITIRDGRYVVPVKAEHRAEIKGLVHDSSASGSTLFIEPLSVVELNNEIKILQKQECDEIDRLLLQLSSEAEEHLEELKRDYNCYLMLDLYFAKAKLGIQMDAVIPRINNQGKINLVKARHPLISKEKVVPIDISLGQDFDNLIITGPNTGGKTVALKTLGLLTLMMMSGLMIPSEEKSELSVFDDVLVDIGDEQSIEQSLSTFSAHMVNIISILKKASSRSLVLIDELGSGTDPVEGASLAIAILEDLKKKKSKLVVTTHYSEIKLYALSTEGVINASCEFDIKTLRPTYKICIGVPGKSNAFLIAKRLGLSEDVLERARSITSEEVNKFEDAISEIESKRLEIERQKAEIDRLKIQIEREKDHINSVKREIENKKNKELERSRQEADKVIDKVKNESEQILRQLEDTVKQKETEDFNKMASEVALQIRSKFKKLDKIIEKSHKKDKMEVLVGQKLKAGDKVKVLDIDQKGVILRDKDGNGEYLVQIGMIKSKVHASNLVKIKEQNGAAKTVVKKSFSKKSQGKIDTEIHLRGMTVDEALFELDKFIDSAVLMGLSVVRIVHGKGTGVLRSAVLDYLKREKSVKEYRLGVYGEGEDGVTIVTLK